MMIPDSGLLFWATL